MKERISIRRAEPSDVDDIVAFNRAMAWETEGKELSLGLIQPGVKGLFDNPQYGFYLVAETEAQVVGSLMVTMEWSDWRNGLLWWIQSVYVRPEWRRCGVYRRLYEKVKSLAREQGGVRGFRLYVEKENQAAHRTYQSLGMQETVYLMFEELDEGFTSVVV